MIKYEIGHNIDGIVTPTTNKTEPIANILVTFEQLRSHFEYMM